VLLGLLALVLLGAPASGQDWKELKSAHFTLRTDLDADAAMQAAVEIERTRAALLAAMWPTPHDAGIEPVDIIILRSRAEFEHYAAEGSRGLYSHSALPPRIVLWGAPDSWEEHLQETTPSGLPSPGLPPSYGSRGGMSGGRRGGYVDPRPPSSVEDPQFSAHLELVQAGSSSVLKHELAHHVASAVYGRLPLWFSEGQAQFLESLKLSEDGRKATIGLINPTAWLEYRRIRAISTLDVLLWETPLPGLSQGESMGRYGVSWQLYQWLFTTHPAALRCYQEGLASGETSPKAWARCFPDLVPEELNKTLWAFSRGGKPAVVELAVPPVGFEVKIRPLEESEVHLVRAQVALAGTRRPELLEEARMEVQAALAADPASVGALQLVAPLVPPKVRLENGRRAVAAHPDDGWAWLLLADALWDAEGPTEERYRAYQRAVQLLPDSPLVLGRAARNLLSRNERPEALALAERASQLAPWNGEVQTIHALALAATGRCSEGVSAAKQARSMLPPGSVSLTSGLEVGFGRACPAEEAQDAGVTTGQR
jgi:tetratricopeptide (TPR) repeat protein